MFSENNAYQTVHRQREISTVLNLLVVSRPGERHCGPQPSQSKSDSGIGQRCRVGPAYGQVIASSPRPQTSTWPPLAWAHRSSSDREAQPQWQVCVINTLVPLEKRVVPILFLLLLIIIPCTLVNRLIPIAMTYKCNKKKIKKKAYQRPKIKKKHY